MAELTVTVNGEEYEIDVNPARSLADVLRNELALTGTQQACSSGVCGACTVRINGEARKSCMHLVGMVEGDDIQTVEGLAPDDDLHPVQQAFIDEFSLQCGFCTPGFVMSAASLLEENDDPSESEIRHALHGNVCRCTGFHDIVNGVKRAATLANSDEETTVAQSTDD